MEKYFLSVEDNHKIISRLCGISKQLFPDYKGEIEYYYRTTLFHHDVIYIQK